MGGRAAHPVTEPVPGQRDRREHRRTAALRAAVPGRAAPAGVTPWPEKDKKPYPLPFHPLDLGEDALRALCGFVVEGRREPGDVDADAIDLHGFLVRDPGAPDPAVKEAAPRAAVAAMGPPRTYVLGADGTLVKRDTP